METSKNQAVFELVALAYCQHSLAIRLVQDLPHTQYSHLGVRWRDSPQSLQQDKMSFGGGDGRHIKEHIVLRPQAPIRPTHSCGALQNSGDIDTVMDDTHLFLGNVKAVGQVIGDILRDRYVAGDVLIPTSHLS